ncbi:MAG TPA: TonB family protein [Sphingomicrobium sp.]|nr:TonB family protein [Sphingomicrobium sp.]
MGFRAVRFVAPGFALLSTAAPAAVPLTPVKPWLVDFDTVQCHAEREYRDDRGSVMLGIRPAPTGDTYELLVARNRAGPRFGRQFVGSVDFGKGPIKAWLLNYGTSDPPLDIMKFRISATEMAQAKTARNILFHIRGRDDVAFAVTAISDLITTLDQCTTALQDHWNMTSEKREGLRDLPKGDLRKIFTFEDYPHEALSRGQEGAAQFLLFIDEQGSVAACHVFKPSGIPALDAMGCQTIRERGKFKPAVDHNGKPARSAYITPPVQWRLA